MFGNTLSHHHGCDIVLRDITDRKIADLFTVAENSRPIGNFKHMGNIMGNKNNTYTFFFSSRNIAEHLIKTTRPGTSRTGDSRE